MVTPGRPGSDAPRQNRSPRYKPDLVRDPGHAGRQVRIAGEQRAAGRGARSGDTAQLLDPLASTAMPIVLRTRAICSASPSASPVHASSGVRTTGLPAGYLGSRRTVSSVPNSRLISARRSSRSQLVDRPNDKSFARVSASAGTNRSKPDPQELELGRKRPIGRGGVDSFTEDVEIGSQLGFQGTRLPLGRPPQTQRAHESVGLEPRRTRDFGQPPSADSPIEVDLPQAVLSVAEALGKPQVVLGPGVDMRDSPAIAGDLDLAHRPAHAPASRCPRKRPAEELVPQPSGGGSRQSRDRRSENAESLCGFNRPHGRQL